MGKDSVEHKSYGEFNRWLMLFSVMVGAFMAILESTIMNVALPHIMTAFGKDIEATRWVTTGFMIAAAIAMPLSGWLGQRLGLGNLYIASLFLFILGSVFNAFSWSLESLIVFRVIQGIAAGWIQPTSMAIITRIFPPDFRGRAIGIWSIGIMTAPTLGPTAGGLIIHLFSWRAVFVLSFTAGIIGILLALVILPKDRGTIRIPFDFQGYIPLALFLLCGLLSVSNGQKIGWDSPTILLGGTLAIGSLLAFILTEWNAPHPIVPLRLFRIPDFSLALFLTLFRSLGLFGTVFLLPIFLYQVQDRDSLSIGLLMMPGSIMMTMTSPMAGFITDKFGGRWPAVAGAASLAMALYFFSAMDVMTGFWLIITPQLFRGFGIAMIMTPVVTTALNAVPPEDTRHAAWMINLCQRAGGAFAISILSTLLNRGTIIQREFLGASALALAEPTAPLLRQARMLGYAGENARTLARAAMIRQVRRAATVLAFQNLYLLAALFTITAIIPAYLLRRFRQ